MTFKYARARVAFLAVIAVFVAVESASIVSEQRRLVSSLAHTTWDHELRLASITILDSLLRGDYASVQPSVESWASAHPEVRSLSVTGANGFVIASYAKKDKALAQAETLVRDITHEHRKIAEILVVVDFEHFNRAVSGLARRLVFISLAMTLAMGLALWMSQRKTALEPLEEEVARRQKSEGELEARVAERTASLKRANDEVMRTLGTLKALVDHMPHGVVLLNPRGRVMLTNPLGEGLLRELSGKRPGEVVTELAGRKIEEFLISPPQLMWHEVTLTGRESPRAPDKALYEVAARRLSGPPGKSDEAPEDFSTTGMVVVMKDVTEQRALEHRAASQEKLAAVGQLASGIAHDFSNILTSVLGFSEILLVDGGLQEENYKYAEAINQSGKRAADLIAQIMDFSRRSVSEPRTVDVRAALVEFLRFLNRLIPENIAISLDSSEEGGFYVRVDPVKLEQVLTNLAVNARDAMPQGGQLYFMLARSEVCPAVKGTEISGHWVTISVRDTGEGIPEETMAHIFEPFFTTKGRGTGLGLAQVYGIVKQHGGYIQVDSAPGRGALFTVYLPEVQAEVLEEEARTLKLSENIQRGAGQKLLVVEDDDVVRSLLKSLLGSLGYSVSVARDGIEGLAAFSKEPGYFDLVLTDMVMPRMGGMEMCRAMAEIRPEVKVIAVSGYPPEHLSGTKDEAGGAPEYGADCIRHWVRKPFNPSELASLVQRTLAE